MNLISVSSSSTVRRHADAVPTCEQYALSNPRHFSQQLTLTAGHQANSALGVRSGMQIHHCLGCAQMSRQKNSCADMLWLMAATADMDDYRS